MLRSPDGEFVNVYGVPPTPPRRPEYLFVLPEEGEIPAPTPRDTQRTRAHYKRASTQLIAACETVWKSAQGSGKHFCICTSVS